MSRSLSGSKRLELVLVGLSAGGLALCYAWIISGTRYMTTGIQFVTPLAIVILVHVAWLAARRELRPGFADVVFARSLSTAIVICAFTALSAIFAPMPATAADGTVGTILLVLACLAVLALVVGAAALVVYAVALAAKAAYNAIQGRSDPPNKSESRIFDAGAIMLSLLAIGTASLEGVAGAFSFSVQDRASSTVTVAAAPARVWEAVGKATSPDFPLPAMLTWIPQPVAVLIDEGATLGARRVVRFKGREGQGDLTLQVVRRTNDVAVFQAISDTSPIAAWVRHSALTFRIEAAGTGTRLTVISDYDRLLSPAWFFRPYTRLAAFLAVDVLARDTGARSEAH